MEAWHFVYETVVVAWDKGNVAHDEVPRTSQICSKALHVHSGNEGYGIDLIEPQSTTHCEVRCTGVAAHLHRCPAVGVR